MCCVIFVQVLNAGSHNIDGKSVDPKKATKKKSFEQPVVKKIYVGGVGEITDSQMRDHFSSYGQVGMHTNTWVYKFSQLIVHMLF